MADLLLLAALVWVESDLQGRISYATRVLGYSVSFSYAPFTQYFTMFSSKVRLTSPPTLDWIHVLAVVLVLLNAWAAYTFLTSRRGNFVKAPAASV